MEAAAAVTPTVGDALRAATARLAAAGVPEPAADAAVLLAHALGTDRTGLVVAARRALPDPAAATFERLLGRRIEREPVFHLVGEREFWSLPFTVDRRVLTPRPETERLVEVALALAADARRVVDLGTGSGCIAAALARALPAARVWAVDREPAALAVARVNLGRHAPGVCLIGADWCAAFRPGSLDLVVANPPYVPDAEVATLAPEVCDFEPRTALAAGTDGLDAVRALAGDAPRVLVPGGWLVLEVGAGQAAAVARLLANRGLFTDIHIERDLAGIERVVAARRGGAAWQRSS